MREARTEAAKLTTSAAPMSEIVIEEDEIELDAVEVSLIEDEVEGVVNPMVATTTRNGSIT